MRRNKREGYYITFVPNIFTINYANDRVTPFQIHLFILSESIFSKTYLLNSFLNHNIKLNKAYTTKESLLNALMTIQFDIILRLCIFNHLNELWQIQHPIKPFKQLFINNQSQSYLWALCSSEWSQVHKTKTIISYSNIAEA